VIYFFRCSQTKHEHWFFAGFTTLQDAREASPYPVGVPGIVSMLCE